MSLMRPTFVGNYSSRLKEKEHYVLQRVNWLKSSLRCKNLWLLYFRDKSTTVLENCARKTRVTHLTVERNLRRLEISWLEKDDGNRIIISIIRLTLIRFDDTEHRAVGGMRFKKNTHLRKKEECIRGRRNSVLNIFIKRPYSVFPKQRS